jgi:hypothetical protein
MSMHFTKRNSLLAFLLAPFLLTSSCAHAQDRTSQPTAHLFAPYADMSLTSAEDLVSVTQKTGIKTVTLAFLSSESRGCAAGWGGLHQTLPEDKLPNGTTVQSLVKDLQKSGVQVIVSFGGQAGIEPAMRCKSASELQALYQSATERYGVKMLDFDLEGKETTDQPSIDRRDRALAGLKKTHPDLAISYTLEVMPAGLVDSGVNLLRSAKKDGIGLDVVNIMAMDYGKGEDNNGQMGADAIDATTATQKQIQAAGLNSKIGITVMIGVNDEKPEVFTLADAQTVLEFAKKTSYVQRLSFWSMERDNGSCAGRKSPSPTCSGIRQSDYEFSRALSSF